MIYDLRFRIYEEFIRKSYFINHKSYVDWPSANLGISNKKREAEKISACLFVRGRGASRKNDAGAGIGEVVVM